MGILAAATAFCKAASAFLRIAWPAVEARKITRQIEEYEDEIFTLADSGTPADKLRIEVLNRRKRTAVEQLGALRSAYSHFNEGD